MENNLFMLLTYFIIYSFLGWVMESTIRSVCEKKIINTGFLEGPFCPIYGCGALIMIVFLNEFENIFVLFIMSFFVLSFWEYVVGVLLEKIFKTKYWDYSDQKFNIHGRVCLLNSIYWGILGVIFTKYMHPFIIDKITLIDQLSLEIAVSVITTLFIVDTIISITKVINIKTTLNKIELLNTQIKEKLLEIKELEMTRKFENNLPVVVEKLKLKRDKTLKRLYKHVYRLKKAFPAINTKEITEILNKKFEFHKKKEK